MIIQPVVPRIPLALQASGGITIDPVTGVVTFNVGALTPAQAAAILGAAVPALPTADPHILNALWNDGQILAISQG